jgi:hypothetical protein
MTTTNSNDLPFEAVIAIEQLRIASIFLCAGAMSARLYEDFVQEVREQARRIAKVQDGNS